MLTSMTYCAFSRSSRCKCNCATSLVHNIVTPFVSYWGQNSYGAANPSDTANFQKNLSFYCQDDSIDFFPMAFLDIFFGPGGEPSINLANVCQ